MQQLAAQRAGVLAHGEYLDGLARTTSGDDVSAEIHTRHWQALIARQT